MAISVALVYLIHFPIFPAVAFLEYDPADIPILIGTFVFGPLSGIVLTVVTSVITGADCKRVQRTLRYTDACDSYRSSRLSIRDNLSA